MTSGRSPSKSRRDGTAIVVSSQRPERERVARNLRRSFTHVVAARDPFDAVARAMDARAQLLVVSLDGLRASDRKFLDPIRRHCLDIRILLLVPEGARAVARAFLKAGADGLLSAPHDDDEFHCVVKSMTRCDGPDVLTGLPNRAAADEALHAEIARVGRDKKSLGFALLDLDRFKDVNERHGYKGGDEVLVGVARILREAFRVSDLVCRWGGEEFQILLPGLPEDTEAARRVACVKLNAVRRAVATWQPPMRTRAGRPLHVTLSGGLAVFPGDASGTASQYTSAHRRLELARPPPSVDGPAALFGVANRRLDAAKAKGRDQIVCGEAACPHGGRDVLTSAT